MASGKEQVMVLGITIVLLIVSTIAYQTCTVDTSIDIDNECVYVEMTNPGIVIHCDKDCEDVKGALYWTYRELFKRVNIKSHPKCTKCVPELQYKRMLEAYELYKKLNTDNNYGND